MIKTVTSTRNRLGECPVWSAREGKLYWMDLLEPAVFSYRPDTGDVERWPMPEYLGGLALRKAGGLVLGMQRRVACFIPERGALEDLVPLGEMGDAVRFNDGKCDCRGRFFIGNMMDPDIADNEEQAEDEKEGAGSIFVLDTDLTFRVRETAYTIPNGFTWNLDYTLLYVADSHENAIFVYDYDSVSGTFSNKRLFASTKNEPGVPDGACLDAEGCLWSARNNGGCIVRYRPDGSMDRKIPLPVRLPTSLAFGGPDLETLFVTSASQGLTPERKKEHPLSGAVLALDAGVKGAPVPMFAG